VKGMKEESGGKKVECFEYDSFEYSQTLDHYKITTKHTGFCI